MIILKCESSLHRKFKMHSVTNGEYNFYTTYLKKYTEKKMCKYRNSTFKCKQAAILFRETFVLSQKSPLNKKTSICHTIYLQTYSSAYFATTCFNF